MPTRLLKSLSPGRALVGLALVMSVALVGTSANIYHSVQQTFTELVRSQAIALLGTVGDRVRLAGTDVTEAFVAELIEELRDRGLRYISLGNGALTSGEATLPPAATHHRRVTLTLSDRRAQISAHRLRLRGHRWRRPNPAVRRFLRAITLELEPTVALAMRAQAQRSLVISMIVALVMIGLALLAARWTKRRQELEQQLEAERRLAALGQMSAVLAHEIRNPLASLKGHAQLLQEMLASDDERVARKTGQVVREAERLELLTNELLEFVRTGSIDLQPHPPLTLLQQLASEHQGRVEVEGRRAPPSWHYDPARLRRALANLIDNALQASPDDAMVTVGVERANGELVITVWDRGKGIVAGEEEAIFEPFHTKRTRGTGLGLAVARRIVEAHGGRLTAENVASGGACFTLRLPRGDSGAHAA